MKLRYGDPPAPEDCVELGSIVAVDVMRNDDPRYGGDMSAYNMYGLRLTPWAMVRSTMSLFKEAPMPYVVDVTNLGRLFVGDDGWELVE